MSAQITGYRQTIWLVQFMYDCRCCVSNFNHNLSQFSRPTLFAAACIGDWPCPVLRKILFCVQSFLVVLWHCSRLSDRPVKNLQQLEAIQRWSAICRVWPWTSTYQKFLLCISSQGQDLYLHQKLDMYIYWFSSESGYNLQTPTTTTTTPDATVRSL